MQHDVFISYSSKDSTTAQAICHELEDNYIRCWIAPRNIPVGSKYASVITEAIKSCKAVVLVFSEQSAISPWVESEINIAFSNRKPIIPYKIDRAHVEDYSEFYLMLNNRHWIEAYPDFKTRFKELVEVVSKIVAPENKVILPTPQYKKVDLGLSVCWADRNVGASSPEDYGDYFAWGETEPKKEYTKDNYEFYDKNKDNFIDIGTDISGTEHDAAHIKCGENMRMPTLNETKELIDKCAWLWKEVRGVSGYKVVGSNGNSIFLPTAGYRSRKDCYHNGSAGLYWSSILNQSVVHNACDFKFNSGYSAWCDDDERYDGCSIRPVVG